MAQIYRLLYAMHLTNLPNLQFQAVGICIQYFCIWLLLPDST